MFEMISIVPVHARDESGVEADLAGLFRGELDHYGRLLQVMRAPAADRIASAAGLVMGEAAEAVPAALGRGFHWEASAVGGRTVISNSERGAFR
jgi:F420-0:gamma-glutamyl ligase